MVILAEVSIAVASLEVFGSNFVHRAGLDFCRAVLDEFSSYRFVMKWSSR